MGTDALHQEHSPRRTYQGTLGARRIFTTLAMRRNQHPQSEGHDPSQNLFTGPVEIVRLGTLTGGTKAQKDRNCCLYCESSESGSLSPGVVSCFLRSRQPAVRTHGAGFPVPHYRGTIFCIFLLRGQIFPVNIKNCIFYPFLSFFILFYPLFSEGSA